MLLVVHGCFIIGSESTAVTLDWCNRASGILVITPPNWNGFAQNMEYEGSSKSFEPDYD